jgi:hypothetical protein
MMSFISLWESWWSGTSPCGAIRVARNGIVIVDGMLTIEAKAGAESAAGPEPCGLGSSRQQASCRQPGEHWWRALDPHHVAAPDASSSASRRCCTMREILNESAARRIRRRAGRRCRLRWRPGVAAASSNRGMTC